MHHITLAKILYRNNSMIDEAFNLWEASELYLATSHLIINRLCVTRVIRCSQ